MPVKFMSIRVIQQDTKARQRETAEIFEGCRPYLDQGMSLRQAVKQVTDRNITNVKNGWYRDLIEYTISQGYDYHKLKWSRTK